jgi:hypothetical protein
MRFLFAYLFIVLAGEVYSQNFLVSAATKEPRRIQLLTMGGIESKYRPDSCQAIVDNKYGITFKLIPGCVITKWRRWRINRNYRYANKKLEQRHGKNWEANYLREVKACKGE